MWTTDFDQGCLVSDSFCSGIDVQNVVWPAVPAARDVTHHQERGGDSRALKMPSYCPRLHFLG